MRIGGWRFVVLGAVGLAASAAVAFVLLSGDRGGLLEPENAQVVARGKAIYLGYCAACHGANLQGQADWQTPDKDGYLPAPPHDRDGHTWHHADKLLFDITKLGMAEGANIKDYRSSMPAFVGVLPDDDIVAVLSYIKSTWPEDILKAHAEFERAYELRAEALR